MDELRDRFAALERVPVPDLWSDIDRRVSDAAAGSRVHGQVTWRAERAPHLSPVFILLLLSLLLALALAVVTVGSRLPNFWTSVVPSPTPSVPTERIDVPPGGGFVPTGSLSDMGCSWCPAVLLDDGRVLVVGGSSVEGGGPAAELYDPTTWTFSPAGPPGTDFNQASAVKLNDGRVLLVGGLSERAEIYDPGTGRFQPTVVTYRQGAGGIGVTLTDGRVLFVGGGLTTSAAIYDPATDELTPTGPAPVQAGDLTATLLDDGRVLVVGDGTGHVYDPAAGVFTRTGPMLAPRSSHTATRLMDGRVLIVGGSTDTETLASAEIYDPASGTFTLTGSMEVPRFWHAAALLPDGRVLVVGGSTDGVRVDAGTFTEIYDPQTGQFTRGPVTMQPRVAATAVALSSGVLVLGHYAGNVGGNHDAATTAELFTLGPVERPVGCCLDNPGFISVSSAGQGPAGRAVLVVPAGGLEAAVGASRHRFSGSSGSWSELSLPNCSEGCSVPIGGVTSSVRVTVEITYEGPPPPQASGIEVVIDASD
jgi:hypothetical protein